jgi:hypothetical protein
MKKIFDDLKNIKKELHENLNALLEERLSKIEKRLDKLEHKKKD